MASVFVVDDVPDRSSLRRPVFPGTSDWAWVRQQLDLHVSGGECQFSPTNNVTVHKK